MNEIQQAIALLRGDLSYDNVAKAKQILERLLLLEALMPVGGQSTNTLRMMMEHAGLYKHEQAYRKELEDKITELEQVEKSNSIPIGYTQVHCSKCGFPGRVPQRYSGELIICTGCKNPEPYYIEKTGDSDASPLT